MADKINTRTVKSYQQKAAAKAQQKPNQYQQEASTEFLTADRAATTNRTGYLMPDLNQEAATETSVDKIMKAGKKESKKNS